MNPSVPVSHGAPASPHAGGDAADRPDDKTDGAPELGYFLQLLLGLVPLQSGADDTLPPRGKKLPPAANDGDQTPLKFAPPMPLTPVLALKSVAVGDGAGGDPAAQVKSALQQLAGDPESVAAALRRFAHSQVAPPDAAATPRPFATAAPAVNAPPPPPPPPASPVPGPAVAVGSPDFGGALGSRVQWMARNDLRFARIDLSPAHLGPVEIHIHLDGDKALVTFGAHHAATRDALEAAVPRLRGLLGDSGLQLVQVNVGQQGMTGRDQRPFTRVPGDAVTGIGGTGAAESDATANLQAGLREGLVDDYA